MFTSARVYTIGIVVFFLLTTPRMSSADPCPIENIDFNSALQTLSHSTCATQVLAQPEEDLLANMGGCMMGVKDGATALTDALKNAGISLAEGTLALIQKKAEQLHRFSRAIGSSSPKPSSVSELQKIAGNFLLQGALEKTQELLSAHAGLVAFKKGMNEYMENYWKEFPCLPEPEKARVRCKLTVQVYLGAGLATKGIPAVLEQTKKGYATAKAMHEFVQRSKSAQGLEKVGLAERIEAATQSVVMRDAEFKEVMTAPNMRIQEYVDPYGKHYFKAERRIKSPDGKAEVWHGQKIDLDKNTLAFNATDVETREFIETLVNQQRNRYSIIYMDLNHLGKMNYPSNAVGDAYLKAFGEHGVAQTLRHTARNSDILVKLGGDEFALLVENQTPEVVKNIAQKIVTNLDESIDAQALFREKIVEQGNLYKGIKTANSVEELPPAIRQGLTPEQLQKGQTDFQQIKPQILETQKKAVKEQAKYSPSISVGTRIIKPEENFKNALQAAEDQATQVKIEYKAARGLQTEKYDQVKRRITDLPNYRAIPRVRDPL